MWTKFLAINILTQLLTSVLLWHHYSTKYKCICEILPISFQLAKTSGTLISINIAIVCIDSLRWLDRYLYIKLPFVSRHSYYIFNILFFSLVHISSHFYNYSRINNWNSGVTYTGYILLVLIYFCLLTLGLKSIKYDKFIISHIYLFVIFYILLFYHQSFCIVNKNCEMLLSVPILFVSITMYILNYIYNYIFSCYKIINVTNHSDNIIQIKLNLLPGICKGIDRNKGNVDCINSKKIWVCCPKISVFEWHPFILVNDSIFIKCRGNWTSKLHDTFEPHNINIKSHNNSVFPKLLVMRESKLFPSNILQLLENPSVIICGGIGLSTFISLLSVMFTKSINYNLPVIIVVKTCDDIKWCRDILIKLSSNSNVKISIYFTDTPFRYSLNFYCDVYYNRPDIPSLLENYYISSKFSKKINVFYSGPFKIKQYSKYNLYSL